MSNDPKRAAAQFFGGRLSLDFANTVDWRLTDTPQELIPDYDALLAWSERRGSLRGQARRRLRKRARTDEADLVMRRAYALRHSIWNAADRLIANKPVDLTWLNAELTMLPRQPRIVSLDAGYVYELDGDRLDEPLWPILWSLSSLFVSGDSERIGRCQGRGCGWFFVDESSNRTRRWCSSEICGNRERARRSYARHRANGHRGATSGA